VEDQVSQPQHTPYWTCTKHYCSCTADNITLKNILGVKSSAWGLIPKQQKSGGTFVYLLGSKEKDF